MQIGVLALQGAFTEHIEMFKKLDIKSKEIRQKSDFNDDISGLVIPGGESTVINKLLHDMQLSQPIKRAILNGLPVFGTCAGLILLARHTENALPSSIALMDITARRNAYGRQLGSFSTSSKFAGMKDVPMVFIRAPYITDTANEVEILATVNGKTVAARQDNMLVTAFHPELTQDLRVHEYFAQMIKDAEK